MEDAAIALAISQTNADTVITDSQQACRNFLRGRISKTALNILLQKPPERKVKIIWTPAHSTLKGNTTAHDIARDLSRQATRGCRLETACPLVTYQDITWYYKCQRMIYPPGHASLTKEQEHCLRLLQTNTFPHPSKLHLLHPTQYFQLCKFCASAGTLYHMVWECSANPKIPRIAHPSREQWEKELSSSGLDSQLRLVERAVAAGVSNGVLE